MGESDTTINHFMMQTARVVSYYGPAVMTDFAENNNMHIYTLKYINEVLLENREDIVIKSSDKWTSEYLDWAIEENDNIFRKMNEEKYGYEVLQGDGIFTGELLGGCVDVFPMMVGTNIWPKKEEWKNKILFLETSEDEIKPLYLQYILRNLVAQGIFEEISRNNSTENLKMRHIMKSIRKCIRRLHMR